MLYSFRDKQFIQEVADYVNMVWENLPLSSQRISQIKQLQLKDGVYQQLVNHCRNERTDKRLIPGILKLYYSVAGEFRFRMTC